MIVCIHTLSLYTCINTDAYSPIFDENVKPLWIYHIGWKSLRLLSLLFEYQNHAAFSNNSTETFDMWEFGSKACSGCVRAIINERCVISVSRRNNNKRKISDQYNIHYIHKYTVLLLVGCITCCWCMGQSFPDLWAALLSLHPCLDKNKTSTQVHIKTLEERLFPINQKY